MAGVPQRQAKKLDVEYQPSPELDHLKKQKVMETYLRVQAGKGSDKDVANIEKAKKAGLLIPNQGGPKAGATPTEKAVGRTGSVMGGAILGAEAGAAIGTAVAPGPGTAVGAVVGGAAGAAGGSLFFDGVEGLLDYFGFPETNEFDTEEALKNAATEAAWEVGTAGAYGVGRVAKAGYRAAKEGVLKVKTPGALARTDALKSMGIEPTIMDVSDNQYIREVFPKVVGRFPLIAGPFQKAGARTAQQVSQGLENAFLKLGPAASLVTAGSDLKKLVDTRFVNIVGGINDKYTDFLRAAKKAGVAVPVGTFAKPVLTAKKTYEAGLPVVGKGRMGSKTDPVLKLLRDMEQLDGTLSAEQFQTLMTRIDSTMGKVSKDPRATSILFRMRGDMEKGFRAGITDPTVAAKLKDADTYLSKMEKTLSAETTRSLSGTTKVSGFQINLDKPGTLSTDELLDQVYRGKPGAYDELVKVAGKPQVAAINRGVIQKIYERSFTGSGIDRKVDISRLIKEFAMDLPSSSQHGLWRKAFKDAGGDYDKTYKFLKAAQVAVGKEIPDVATFAARRAMLGGWRSLVSLITPTTVGAAGHVAGGPAGGMAALSGVYLTRRMARIITDPKALDAAQEAIDLTKPINQRRMAWLRLFTLMGDRPATQELNKPYATAAQ